MYLATLLVVDDNASFRSAVVQTCRNAGYNVVSIANGRAAQSVLQTLRPDLILLDIAMPDLDGLALLRAIRSSLMNAAVPVLIVTAMTDRQVFEQADALGISGFLLKTAFSMDELLATIARCLAEAPKSTDAGSVRPTKASSFRKAPSSAPRARPNAQRRSTRHEEPPG